MATDVDAKAAERMTPNMRDWSENFELDLVAIAIAQIHSDSSRRSGKIRREVLGDQVDRWNA
jgi:hypothetical protein